MKTDTIAAIATGLSSAGISIIRISGEDAIKIVDKIFCAKRENFCLEDAKTHTLHYGIIRENRGEKKEQSLLDEVLVSVMRAPNTYTRENIVEVNCHGGIVVTKKILDEVIRAGARLAEPGEFTKRAFLNGRIDLSQAEAVSDIIQAKNNMALKNSVGQLKGNMYKEISELRQQILSDMAFIEAALDDPEHISSEGFAQKLNTNIEVWQRRVGKLLKTAKSGRLIKEGIRTVILGKPNAGKSSLLNFMLGENRAIVTDIAGTTRDILEENIMLNGISLNIVDTAGIRWTKDTVERIGVDKAKQAAKDADLILFVVDSSVRLDENDREILKSIAGKKVIVLLNKMDLPGMVNKTDMEAFLDKFLNDCENDFENGFSGKNNWSIIRTSTKVGEGLEELENKITEMFFGGELNFNDEIYVTNIRHRIALEETNKSLGQVLESIQMGMPEDFYSIDLMNAYRELGSILGEEVDEDLINTIFREFCMGK